MNFFALALHTRSAGLADNTLLFDEVRQRCRINEAALAANAASTELRRDSKDRIALRDYNFALSRVFTVIRDSHLNPWAHPLRLPGPGGEYVLTHPPHGNRFWNPQDFDLIPADELDVRGKFVLPRITRNGVGASLVAVRSEQSPETRQQFVAARVYFAITAVVQFSGRRCEIEFMDPLPSRPPTFWAAACRRPPTSLHP